MHAVEPSALSMDEILRDHGKLVSWQVSRMRIPPGSFDDMVQEALLAVTRKLPRFDPAIGRIQGWICATVRHAVIDAMRATVGGPIRVSRHHIRRCRERGEELGEICASLDEHLETGEEATYRAVQDNGSVPHTELVEKRDMLAYARAHIPERLREVLDLLYPADGSEPVPMREAGRRLGVSESRVSQLRKEALLAMRSMLGVSGRVPRYARAG